MCVSRSVRLPCVCECVDACRSVGRSALCVNACQSVGPSALCVNVWMRVGRSVGLPCV